MKWTGNCKLKVSSTYGRLHATVWQRGGITTATTLQSFKVVVMTTLLYTCKAWTVYSRHPC